jgi:hypothetical protein
MSIFAASSETSNQSPEPTAGRCVATRQHDY